MTVSTGFAKQLGFGLRINYPALNGSFKENGLNEENKSLFLEEKKLINLYADFVDETIGFYELMRGDKK